MTADPGLLQYQQAQQAQQAAGKRKAKTPKPKTPPEPAPTFTDVAIEQQRLTRLAVKEGLWEAYSPKELRKHRLRLMERRRDLGLKIQQTVEHGRTERLKRLQIQVARAAVKEAQANAVQARQEARLARQERMGFMTAARQRKIVRIRTRQALGALKDVPVRGYDRSVPGAAKKRRPGIRITVTQTQRQSQTRMTARRRKGRKKVAYRRRR